MVTPAPTHFFLYLTNLSSEKNLEMQSTRASGAQSDSHPHINHGEDDGEVQSRPSAQFDATIPLG